MGNRLARYRRDNLSRRTATGVMVRDEVKFKGGLNLIDSAQEVSPGEFQVGRNVEPYFANGAPERVAGHEVFDGQPRPHLANYWKVELTGISSGPFTVGETVTATPSNATGTLAAYTPDPDSNNAGTIIVTDLSDEVDPDETWTGGSSGASGVSAEGSEFQGETENDAHDAAQIAAEAIRRNAITTVGDTACSGPVRGINVYGGNVYAFRDNAAGSAGTMWKATSSGWEQVDLGIKIRFTGGSVPFQEGDTVTGGTSTATCEVKRIVVTAGFWAGDDAEGYIITDAVTSGPFQNSEDLTVSASTYATAAASNAQTPQTLSPGGVYRFRNHNFGGHTRTARMYGCCGTDFAFEFDGDTFVQIETGMVDDQPTEVGVHRGHLLLAYPGGSLQHSGKNQPLSFSPVTGANEILAGDEITGFIEEVGDVTFVFTRNNTYRLEGFVQENIQLKLHNSETGAIAESIQRLGRGIYLDDRGFTSIPTTDRFGDFASNQVSVKIEPLVQSFLESSSVACTVVNKGKSLYRCFFENGEGITIGMSGNQVNGITTIDFGINPNCTPNPNDTTIGGKERIFVGADDGYVYELDVGRNFNGETIEAYFVSHYHFSGNAEYNKRYRRATIYAESQGRMSIEVFADYDYNEDPQNFEEIMDRAEPLGGGRYGIARHSQFLYSRASKTDIRVPMNSHARNVALIVYSNERNEEPWRIYGLTYHLSRRRMIRR